MEIIKYEKKYKNETAKLIQDTFSEFNSTDGDEEAVKNYIRIFSTENQESLDKMFSDDLMIFLAIKNNKIIGMIRANKERIFGLFVDKKNHKRGIASSLMEKIESEMKKLGTKVVRVNSSTYAIDFYKKQGFEIDGEKKEMMGLKMQPMKKKL